MMFDCIFCNKSLTKNHNPNEIFGTFKTDTVNHCDLCGTSFIHNISEEIAGYMIPVNINNEWYQIYRMECDNRLLIFKKYQLVMDMHQLPDITPFNAKEKLKIYLTFI